MRGLLIRCSSGSLSFQRVSRGTVLRLTLLLIALPSFTAARCLAADESLPWEGWLAQTLLEPGQTMRETEAFVEPRVARVRPVDRLEDWQKLSADLRRETLERVIYRGAASQWKDRPAQVEWLETIPGGDGYEIRKLRYEAVPGLWIPALLYVPDEMPAKTPVILNVNGHDAKGKAAPYKQARCINFAKRGMLALNVEWLGMGQLRVDGNSHGRLNQLDLCGTCGLAPFYESMRRGLDLLLEQPHADPTRVAVAGLSGGGWQTIIISALDPRVTLSNPVAGYSSFVTRIHHHTDLGDSEQTPVDLGAVADYTHLTAMLAPRSALLTYNVKDDCCFASAHALPPLLEAASPLYTLYGQPQRLRSHVNYVPGTHNFEKDNREALYRMVADQFFGSDPAFPVDEIDCADELKSAEELNVELPAANASLHDLALELSRDLPRDANWPADANQVAAWRQQQRETLIKIVQAHEYSVRAEPGETFSEGANRAVAWRFRVGDHWTVPGVEIRRDEPKNTVILIHDKGRKAVAGQIESWLAQEYRVLAIDPFYLGESYITERGYLFPLLVATVGERPLGIQASQIAAIAQWLKQEQGATSITLHTMGERSTTIGLVAAVLAGDAVTRVRCDDALASLKQIVERNDSFEKAPEQFCFGLLDRFDVRQLVALVAPREVQMSGTLPRLQSELADLEEWYERLGKKFRPVP